jgi:hypothetical protein
LTNTAKPICADKTVASNVRFGSLADIYGAKRHVRFTPNSDRKSGFPHKVMSALPPKADMCSATRDVRYGPIADIASKLVRAAKNVAVPRPRGSVINDAPRPQCDIRTGTVIVFRIARVAPPRTNSRRREWP